MLGLDVAQFRKDVKGAKVRERIESDLTRARSLGVEVAPTLFIDKRQVETKDGTPEKVHSLIEEAVKAKGSAAGKK
jgi:predicted DsbA family dithiol-disulfide isomerase